MSRLRARTVMDDERQRVAVVESLAISRQEGGNVYGLFVRLEPVAIVVRATNGIQAFSTNAEPVDLDCLLNEVEDLRVLLEQ